MIEYEQFIGGQKFGEVFERSINCSYVRGTYSWCYKYGCYRSQYNQECILPETSPADPHLCKQDAEGRCLVSQ